MIEGRWLRGSVKRRVIGGSMRAKGGVRGRAGEIVVVFVFVGASLVQRDQRWSGAQRR